MNENLICESSILENQYKYYLVECIGNINRDSSNTLRYGIRINKYNEAGEVVESKCVPNIFESKEKMIKGIRILNKLQVTPITLEDIVMDNVYLR